jgi:tRNA-Thr(GGU) m(6)t(6)A37 methyltransferase TsaA
MKEKSILFQPIGVVRSPYKKIEDMPIQPSGASGIQGTLVIDPTYIEGLQDLEGFSHIYVLYFFHHVREHQLIITPFLDKEPHGVFATRAPKRPNPIGLSILRLVEVTKNTLTVENVDILEGTPLLDIKPYVPIFDLQTNVRIGWLREFGDNVKTKRSDERFK